MEVGKVTIYPNCEKCGKKYDPRIGCMWCGHLRPPEYTPPEETEKSVYIRRLYWSVEK